MDRYQRTLKIILIILSALLLTIGLSFLLYGILIATNLLSKCHLPKLVLIAAGSILLFANTLALLGCLCEAYNCLLWFVFFGLITAAVLIAAGIVIFAFGTPQMNTTLGNVLLSMIKKYHQNNITAEFVDYIQCKYQCCGKDGPHDYNSKIPKSCCPDEATPCSPYTNGCYKAIREYYSTHSETLAIVMGFIIIVLQIVCIVIACALAHYIQKNLAEEADEEEKFIRHYPPGHPTNHHHQHRVCQTNQRM